MQAKHTTHNTAAPPQRTACKAASAHETKPAASVAPAALYVDSQPPTLPTAAAFATTVHCSCTRLFAAAPLLLHRLHLLLLLLPLHRHLELLLLLLVLLLHLV